MVTSFADGRYVCMDSGVGKWDAFSRWLKAAMAARQVGIRQLETYAGVSRSTLSVLLRGIQAPRLETVHKLARYFGVTPDVILDLIGPEQYTAKRMPDSTLIGEATGVILVPVVEQEAGAGRGVAVLDYEYVSPTITGRHNVVAVRVRGDSMSPRIEDGDTVIVDRDKEWFDGNVVLARVDDRLLIKRVARLDHSVRLHPDNPKYPDEITTDANILGVVIRVIKPV